MDGSSLTDGTKGYFTGVTNRTCEIDGTAVTDGEAVTDGLYIKNHKSTVLIIFLYSKCVITNSSPDCVLLCVQNIKTLSVLLGQQLTTCTKTKVRYKLSDAILWLLHS